MIKSTQIFGWEHEPVAERPSEFMPSRLSGFSEFSSFGALDRKLPPRKSPWPASRQMDTGADDPMRSLDSPLFRSLELGRAA